MAETQSSLPTRSHPPTPQEDPIPPDPTMCPLLVRQTDPLSSPQKSEERIMNRHLALALLILLTPASAYAADSTARDGRDPIAIIGIAATLVVSIATLIHSLQNDRRASFVNTVTSSRLRWIDSLRDRSRRVHCHDKPLSEPARLNSPRRQDGRTPAAAGYFGTPNSAPPKSRGPARSEDQDAGGVCLSHDRLRRSCKRDIRHAKPTSRCDRSLFEERVEPGQGGVGRRRSFMTRQTIPIDS